MAGVMKDHISVSQFNTYSRCQYQWYLRYIRGETVPPFPNMTIGKATHEGVENAYTQIMTEDKFIPNICTDVTRDKITNDVETDWTDTPKATAIDNSTSMVKAYFDGGYVDDIHQEQITGVEMKADFILKLKDSEIRPRIVGYADIVLKDRIIDLKTGKRKKTKADGFNYIQNGIYANYFGVKGSEVHVMSYKKKGAEVNDYNVPLIPIPALFGIINGFWQRLLISADEKDFMPTGLIHDWACSYCGYGRTGKCKYKMITGG